MSKLSQIMKGTFTVPVSFSLADDSAVNESKNFSFTMTFERVPVASFFDSTKTEPELLKSVTKGWDGLEVDGEKIPFNSQSFDEFSLIPQAINAAYKAYLDGAYKERVKN